MRQMTLLLCDHLNSEKTSEYKNIAWNDIDNDHYFLYTIKELNKPNNLLIFFH
jgi:hypothetical protein